MRRFIGTLLLIIAFLASDGQPGNGNANGHGNGKGNGNGGCGSPPCGGPHVPIDAEWLLIAGVVTGIYLKIRGRRPKP
ncbi:MAG TPA: hypothetical protein VGD40_21395 [Chryseosolibacter sp.]